MSKTNIKFYRTDTLPTKAAQGEVYFLHTDSENTINVYDGTEFEEYGAVVWDNTEGGSGDTPQPESSTSGTVTSITPGVGLVNGDNTKIAITTSGTLNLTAASDTELGGFKTGFTEDKTKKNYPVKIDPESKKAYVNVPWEGGTVDLSGYLPTDGSGVMSGAIKFSSTTLLNASDSDLLTYGGNTITITKPLKVSGKIDATAFYETSDARKKDIKSDLSLDKCYDLIDKCQTVIYSLKDQTQEQVGMIAQEIEEFFPEVVATDADGFKSLAYDRLVVICFKVLKDVIKRLEKLEL